MLKSDRVHVLTSEGEHIKTANRHLYGELIDWSELDAWSRSLATIHISVIANIVFHLKFNYPNHSGILGGCPYAHVHRSTDTEMHIQLVKTCSTKCKH